MHCTCLHTHTCTHKYCTLWQRAALKWTRPQNSEALRQPHYLQTGGKRNNTFDSSLLIQTRVLVVCMHAPHIDREAVAPAICAMAGFGCEKGHAAPGILSSEHRPLFLFCHLDWKRQEGSAVVFKTARGLSELKISQLLGKAHWASNGYSAVA